MSTGPGRGSTTGQRVVPTDLMRHRLRGVLFQAVRMLLYGLLRLVSGFRVAGAGNVPRRGPMVVVANHIHNLDPLVVAVAIPRPVHFMAKKELFAVPILGPVITFCGTFPVDRGRADRQALRVAEATLDQGIGLGIFPEGTRSPGASIAQSLPGAAMIALRSGAPVLPVAVTGTQFLPWNGSRAPKRRYRRETLVTIGQPFVLPRLRDGHRVTSDEATDTMMRAVAALLPPEYRGMYTDPEASA